MAVDIILPMLGETMDEATIVKWLVDVGQAVQKGEPIYQVETDKAILEVDAPADGVLSQVFYEAGCKVPVPPMRKLTSHLTCRRRLHARASPRPERASWRSLRTSTWPCCRVAAPAVGLLSAMCRLISESKLPRLRDGWLRHRQRARRRPSLAFSWQP
jgi:hypothetical protein